MATTAVDGRTARAQRTRAAVVRALLDLISEGDPRPTAREIAARAGTSLRSVYVHFDDVEDLYVVAVRVHLRDVAEHFAPIDASLPLDARVDAFVRQRAGLYEGFGAIRRAASAAASSSPALRGALERGAQVALTDTERLFGDLVDGPDRAARLEAVNALASPGTWDDLRAGRRLAVERARAALVLGITAILTSTTGAP